MSFARHNITHLSASSLGLWRSQPALWAIKYLGGFRDEGNAAMWRGKAVEAGLEWWLRRKDKDGAHAHAMQAFEYEAQGLADDETDAERSMIAPMVEQAIQAFDGFNGELIATQLKVECRLDGLDVPIIGYLDFVFDGGMILDLKTTKACPSAPRPEHCRQVALYCHAREVDSGSLLYVTAKKSARLPVEEIEQHVASVRRDALSLQRFLSSVRTAADAVNCLPADTDSFYWSDASRAELYKFMEIAA